MATLKHFLKKYGQDSFEKTEFTECDYLVLTVLSYANFKNTIYFNKKSKEGFIDLSVFGKASLIEKLSKNYLTLGNSYINFLELLFQSRRYEDVKIGYFYDYFSEHKEIQFFALSFLIDNKYIVVYRGTDNSINGWKEDFNMAVKSHVPSQVEARNYLEKRLTDFSRKKVTILGHSKGGNLAYYSYFNIPKRKRNRIVKVYNFDGPGFMDDKYDYSEYNMKLFKLIPEDGVIGCLLDGTSNHEIVKSTRINVAGHDMLTWVLDRKNDFKSLKRMDDHTPFYYAFSESINEWVNKYDPKYLKEMVDFIFTFVDTNNIFTLNALFKDLIFKTDLYKDTVKNYDEESKQKIKEICLDFVDIYMKNFLKDRVDLKKIFDK